MYIVFEIKPKNSEEYYDVMDVIGEYLDLNNIEHRIFEYVEEINYQKKVDK